MTEPRRLPCHTARKQAPPPWSAYRQTQALGAVKAQCGEIRSLPPAPGTGGQP
jgi:hypothetical protein